MARPKKVGLEYFPLDCQMDDKILMLEAEHGMEGFGVYIRLLQYCYQIEDGRLDMSIVFRWKTLGKTLGIPPENLRTMVETMLEIGLFDRKVFDDEQKLTSNGIQKRLNQVAELRQKERLRKAKADSEPTQEFSSGKPENSTRKSTQKERDISIDISLKGKDKLPISSVVPTFEAFWQTYDKKLGKLKAQQKWKKLTDQDKIDILTVLPAYVAVTADERCQFRQHPATFLQNQSWKDEDIGKPQLTTGQPNPAKPVSAPRPIHQTTIR